MDFGLTTYGLGLLAGALSTLSPCVLPLIPVLISSAVSAHRFGAVALCLGLALSFAVMGTLLATAGAALSVDPEAFQSFGAFALIAFGLLLLLPALQNHFARMTGGIGRFGSQLLGRVTLGGLKGQFLVGALLGVVWSPCVGPTLGAATALASQGQHLAQIGLLMTVFGIGAAGPLLTIGSLSRASLLRIRGSTLRVGLLGKQLFGALLVVLGSMVATGLDKRFQAWILDHSPAWLTGLTTRY